MNRGMNSQGEHLAKHGGSVGCLPTLTAAPFFLLVPLIHPRLPSPRSFRILCVQTSFLETLLNERTHFSIFLK